MYLINLHELELNIPTTNFGEFSTLIAGQPKIGKSEFCTKFDKPLILDFEEGTKGKVVYRIPVKKWTEVKQVVRQLTSDLSLKDKYQTVCFDTVNYAFGALKQYAMDTYQEGTDKVIDTFNKIPYGGGWEILENEFKTIVNNLKRAGYGVVFVAHIKDKTYNRDLEDEYTKTVPDLTDRERNIVSAMVDFLLTAGFEIEIVEPAVKNKEGKIIKSAVINNKRILYLRTNNNVEAGFRWANVPEKIDFDYDELKKVFEIAVREEIETGKEKYGLSDKKVKDLTKQKEKERIEEEQKIVEENKLEDVVQQIMELAKQKKSDGVKAKEINAILQGDPRKLTDLGQAQSILEELNKLQGVEEVP